MQLAQADPLAATSVLLFPAFAFALALTCVSTTQCCSCWSLLRQSRGKDLRGQVKHLPEVLDALIGEGVVVPLPAVDFTEVVAGSKGPEYHHHLDVWDVLQLVVLAGLVVLLHHHHTLLEEVLQDCAPGLLRDQHHGGGSRRLETEDWGGWA